MIETRAIIQIGDMSMNLEGSENFVAAQIDRFAEIFMSRANEHISAGEALESEKVEQASSALRETKTKKPRASNGAGAGCAAKVKGLLAEGFFAKGQSSGQVESKLREQATPYSKSKISAALISMTSRKILRRYQENGEWLYQVP